ncbi:hypothetical protein B9479_007529 [Cryptococcus floricola]|uniref:CxC1-like cysteine cluster associated with KDZ transposases domain-containing protein n=1 Tax=Cryptococcus floricola TaxID=2591691 RepID=A0A5D3APC3_9TREE|nr:hypothetical protein B9479_007529 [Cryptococcus floricola]
MELMDAKTRLFIHPYVKGKKKRPQRPAGETKDEGYERLKYTKFDMHAPLGYTVYHGADAGRQLDAVYRRLDGNRDQTVPQSSTRNAEEANRRPGLNDASGSGSGGFYEDLGGGNYDDGYYGPTYGPEDDIPPPHVRDKIRQTENWAQIRPALFAAYVDRMAAGVSVDPICPDSLGCGRDNCKQLRANVVFVTFSSQLSKTITFCKCGKRAIRLMEAGFVSTTPEKPQMAFSLHLLIFIDILWRNSPQSLSGLGLALWEFHEVMSETVKAAQGSHRPKGAQKAMLQTLAVYRDMLLCEDEAQRIIFETTPATELALKCPACFGPRQDHDLAPGDPDVLVCEDGNFGHKRYNHATKHEFRDDDLSTFLPQRDIDQAEARCSGQMVEQDDDAVGAAGNELDGDAHSLSLKGCGETNWKAMKEGAGNQTFKGLKDSGLFALVCRHDVCLKLVSLKQGERQYIPYALIFWLRQALGAEAKIGVLYDIACHFWTYLGKRNLFKSDRDNGRLIMAVSVFHAFAHAWSCQVDWNPRLIDGFGLTDGEGTERLWAALACLIALNTNASSFLRKSNLFFLTESLNDRHLFGKVTYLKDRSEEATIKLNNSMDTLRTVLDKNALYTEETLTKYALEQRQRQSKSGIRAAERERDKVFDDFLEKFKLQVKYDKAYAQFRRSLQTGTREEQVMNAGELEKFSESLKGLTVGLTSMAKALAPDMYDDDAQKFYPLGWLRQLYQDHSNLVGHAQRLRHLLQRLDRPKAGMGPPLGESERGKIMTNTRSSFTALNKAVARYNASRESYIRASHKPLLFPHDQAMSAKEALNLTLQPEHIFWKDMAGHEKAPAWATDPVCQDGINALHTMNRSKEELRRIHAETARMIRWISKRRLNIEQGEEEWKQKRSALQASAGQSLSDRTDDSLGSEDSAHQSGPIAGLDRHQISRLTGYFIKKQKRHLERLENYWIGESLVSLWTSQTQEILVDPEVTAALTEIRLQAGKRKGVAFENEPHPSTSSQSETRRSVTPQQPSQLSARPSSPIRFHKHPVIVRSSSGELVGGAIRGSGVEYHEGEGLSDQEHTDLYEGESEGEEEGILSMLDPSNQEDMDFMSALTAQS